MSYVATGNSGVWKTDWNPTISGFSVLPTGQTALYSNVGKAYSVLLFFTGDGTTNAAAITFTLPAVALVTAVVQVTRITNNGTVAVGYISTAAGSNIASVSPTIGGTSWTNGSGRISANFTYPAQ